jgi:histidine triad (HIT) family protein
MTDCVFCRIVAGEIPAEVVERTEAALVIRDLNPQAPTHLLVIPKEHAADLGELVASASPADVGQLFSLASKIGRDAGSGGYRVVVNEGKEGGQTVFHLHIHVLAGRPMRWPPG